MPTVRLPAVDAGERGHWISQTWDLELWTVVSHHLGAGNQTQVLGPIQQQQVVLTISWHLLPHKDS